jgi:O-acetyl-ADP-ribose deacetylase
MTHKRTTLRVMAAGAVFISSIAGKAANIDQSYLIGPNTTLIIKKGDITQSGCTAIVNAANKQLTGGAGVCGAIFDAAGWNDLQAACDTYPMIQGARCPVGNAVITHSFNLQTRGIMHIIHAVGPDCRIVKNPQEQDRLLKDAYTNSLLLADKHHVDSVAFPFISSAIYAFPKKRACQIALESIREYCQKRTSESLQSVHIVLHSQEDFDLFKDMLEGNVL